MHNIHCVCGTYLGPVTDATNGLCVMCGRSLWMQAARLDTPNSELIATQLNNAQAECCLCCWRYQRRNRDDWKRWIAHKSRYRYLFDKPIRGRVIKTVCISICGVTLRNPHLSFHYLLNTWEAIPVERRQAWFERVINQKFQQPEQTSNL